MTSIPRIYALLHNGGVALVASPVDIPVDHTLTPAEAAQLTVLLWMPPAAAVALARQLIDVASVALTPNQIDQILDAMPNHAQVVAQP